MRVAVARDAQQRFQAVIGLFSPFSFPETLQSFVYCHPKEITGRIFRTPASVPDRSTSQTHPAGCPARHACCRSHYRRPDIPSHRGENSFSNSCCFIPVCCAAVVVIFMRLTVKMLLAPHLLQVSIKKSEQFRNLVCDLRI